MTTLGTAYNASEVSGTQSSSTRLETKTIKDNPIYIKVVPILSKKDAQGNFLKYLKYDQMPYTIVRNGKAENWTRPSLELSGFKDPQKEYADSLQKTIKEWEKGGFDKLPEYAHQYNQMKNEHKAIKPQTKVAILVICPNDPKVHVLTTSRTITDQLFGKPAWGTAAAVESLTDSMRKNNEGDLFNLKATKGWAKLWRTGSTFMDTRYHAEPAKELRTITDAATGQTMSIPMIIDAPVHPAILQLDTATLPDPVAHVNNFPWSVDEVNEYAQNGFKTLPRSISERIAKYLKTEGAVAATGPTPPPTPAGFTAPVLQVDDVPAAQPQYVQHVLQVEAVPHVPHVQHVLQVEAVQHVQAAQPQYVQPVPQPTYAVPAPQPTYAVPVAQHVAAQAPAFTPPPVAPSAVPNLAQFMAANLPPKAGG